MLRELAPELWVTERPQRFYGIEVGTRMTVVRLPGNRLLIHSPVALGPELRRALDALGAPRFVIAPNRFHHLHAAAYGTAYPGLQLYVASGLETKRPDLVIQGILNDTAPSDWRDQIEQLVFRGYPLLNEIVLLHRSTRTLIVSDLVFNLQADSPALTRILLGLVGGYGHFGPSQLEKVLIRDRLAARESLERILAWDFDRVIMAHGHVLESGGREALRQGYAWLL